ncbi:protein of unknown function [Magnetospira sp. QH-2]|nr:protein of unknown function [Magnetospira sp. QH-2]
MGLSLKILGALKVPAGKTTNHLSPYWGSLPLFRDIFFINIASVRLTSNGKALPDRSSWAPGPGLQPGRRGHPRDRQGYQAAPCVQDGESVVSQGIRSASR